MSDKPENDSCKDIATDLREDARQIRRVREIATRIEPQPTLRGRFLDEIFEAYADRLEAALKRTADSIHRAMVILAGIEMPDADYPPRLWTALEDAYDALSDALGTDGDTTADEEEARANGRHFVIQPHGDAAKLRKAQMEALEHVNNVYDILSKSCVEIEKARQGCREARGVLIPALSAPPRNCDRLSNSGAAVETYRKETGFNTHRVELWTAPQIYAFIDWLFASATEQEGGTE